MGFVVEQQLQSSTADFERHRDVHNNHRSSRGEYRYADCERYESVSSYQSTIAGFRKLIRVICETGDNEDEKAIDPLRESDAGIRPWSRASPDPCGANRKTAEQLYGRELPRCRHKERRFKIDQADT